MARYKSRATRASEQASEWRDVAQELRDAGTREEGDEALVRLDQSELGSLKEEMESWRDNIQEKFSQTQKYEDVSAACEALDGIDLSELEGKSYDDQADFEGNHEDDADALDGMADELEGVDFPGMY